MKKLLTFIDQANPTTLFWVIVAISIVLAAQMQAIQHGWINPDSVFYLEAAKHIGTGNFQAAYNIFNWPFYAACIGAIHKLTSFDVHLSAQLLNMIFFGITTSAFLKVIQLTGGKNLAVFAGALLLFGNLYIVGDVLEMLMRDEGFWAFYLLSIVFFIRFYQKNKLSDALLWQVTAILAVLFRIEAITFLFFLPLIFIFHTELPIKERLIKLLKTYSISLIAITIIFITINMIDSLSIKNFGRLNEVFNSNLWGIFTQNIVEKSSIMADQVLGPYLDEYATVGLLITFAYVILEKNIATLGIVGTVLVALHIKSKLAYINNEAKRTLATLTCICLLNMALIITKVFVLSSRYVVAMTFILLIIAALYLGHLLKLAKNNEQTRWKWLTYLTVITLCLFCLKNVLPKGDGYNHMQDAVAWVKQTKSKSQSVFYGSSRLRYYAGKPFIGSGVFSLKNIKSASTKAVQYDYLVLCFGKRDKNKINLTHQTLPTFKEVKRFYAPRERKYCAIYHQ